MGREAICHAKYGRESGEGKVLLETDDLLFRGDFRVKVPLRDVIATSVKNGVLTVEWPEGRLALSLGRSAEKWAQSITSPKTVVEKLGVKPGMKVVLVGRFETSFRTDVMNALGEKPGVKPVAACDLVFVLLVHPNDMDKFEDLAPAIFPDGGLWAVYPKGRKDLSEDTVRKAAREAGLVDIKVVRVSEELGALKLVIPKAARSGKTGKR
jgi:hypothetical protein